VTDPTPGRWSDDQATGSPVPAAAGPASSGSTSSGEFASSGTSGTADPSTSAETEDRGRAASTAKHAGTGLLGLIRETVIVVAIALVLSLLVKTFLVQAFFIPSQSMEDTLLIGDRVIVSKLTPGPFPLERGDIVVFVDPGGWLGPTEAAPQPSPLRRAIAFVGLLPNDSNNHLIKRVIGMPGDHVVCCDEDGLITVNGQPLDETYVRDGSVPSERDFDIRVPAGRVWVMGDNRQESEDSRFHDDGKGNTGSVPISLVTGRAVAVVWPLSHAARLTRPGAVFAKVPPASS
jgi:signal peptidase I